MHNNNIINNSFINSDVNLWLKVILFTTTGDDYNIPHRVFNYTFLAGEKFASPDGNITIIDDFHSETDEVLYLQILQVSLPYGIETKDKDPVQIIIVDDESELLK